jgi:hypothetical protein
MSEPLFPTANRGSFENKLDEKFSELESNGSVDLTDYAKKTEVTGNIDFTKLTPAQITALKAAIA